MPTQHFYFSDAERVEQLDVLGHFPYLIQIVISRSQIFDIAIHLIGNRPCGLPSRRISRPSEGCLTGIAKAGTRFRLIEYKHQFLNQDERMLISHTPRNNRPNGLTSVGALCRQALALLTSVDLSAHFGFATLVGK
jgi:hypothetical protein